MPARAVPAFLLGLLVLLGTHVGAYTALTGDAREGLATIEAAHDPAALAGAREPGAAPYVGTPDYATWLRGYERWHAAEAHATHARHEGLVRIGMILSFLIGLGMLVGGFWRVARTPRRRATDRPARARLRPVPARATAPTPLRARRLRKSA